MRRGHWIILDELNLAPTDVLEALNRLLDDNRELFVAETQEVIKAHPGFMLFATQNPPGLYGGRKVQMGLCGSMEASSSSTSHILKRLTSDLCSLFLSPGPLQGLQEPLRGTAF